MGSMMDDETAGTESLLHTESLETFPVIEHSVPAAYATRPLTFWRRLLVEFGRAVTNVLQNIRTYDRDRFDRWYEPIQKQMASDPLLKHFYKIRSEILKEGSYSGG